MMSATGQLLAKELRLQKSNAMFTLAVVLLGGLGLISATGAGPEIAGFSTDEIRTGLFATVILPVLCGILPLMIGSTAAAAEKSMGVWPWQAALPVSRFHLVLIKVLVVSASIIIVAGILPYLVQVVVPREAMIYFVFRSAWPGWVGLLCGGIGFYAGALARDDYQGLLLSLLPLLGIVFVMGMADPLMLVFPVQASRDVFWMPWALAFRLLLIAGILVFCAAKFVGRTSQGRWPWVCLHAVVISAAVFGLTQWNVVTERSLLTRPSLTYSGVEWPGDSMNVMFTHPIPIAALKEPPRVKAQKGYKSAFGYRSLLKGDDHTVAIGELTRYNPYARLNDDRRSNHPYLITQSIQVREFPQAGEGTVTGWTDDGRFISVMGGGQFLICGPCGLAIRSDWMPYSLFNWLRTSMNFNEVPGEDRTLPMLGAKLPGYSGTTGLTMKDGKPVFVDNGLTGDAGFQNDDLILQPAPKRGIIWKDGRKHLTKAQSGQYLRARQSNDPDAATAVVVNDAGVTTTAVLKPAGKPFEYELAGWVKGDFAWASDDFSVGMSAIVGESGHLITRLDSTVSANDVGASNSLLESWIVSSLREMADGTEMRLRKFDSFDITKIAGETYTRFLYEKFGSVSFGNTVRNESFPFEQGIVLVNLETGNEKIIPIPLPWPASWSIFLQKTFPMWSFYRTGSLSATGNEDGRMVIALNGYAAAVIMEGIESRLNTRIKYMSAFVPGMESGVFLNSDIYVFNDQTNMMLMDLRDHGTSF